MKDKFAEQVKELFTDFTFLKDSKEPVMIGRLPDEILLEFDEFTNRLIRLKNHRLSFLKNHLNVGMNKFQASVPNNVLEDSFVFAYLNHLGEHYTSTLTSKTVRELKRRVVLRRNHGHYDHYDLWINFIEPGDVNSIHNHSGSISGVVYIDNEIGLPTLFEDGTSYQGQRGDIILFPSYFRHMVEENKSNKTRITYAFNLEVLE